MESTGQNFHGATMLELTEDQVRFLYQLLDQVSVSGEENKAMIVEIMRLLRANIDPEPAQ